MFHSLMGTWTKQHAVPEIPRPNSLCSNSSFPKNRLGSPVVNIVLKVISRAKNLCKYFCL